MLVYFLLPNKKYQWIILLLASYVFYLFAGYRYVGFLILTTLTTYFAALFIDLVLKKQKKVLKEHKSLWDKEQKKAFKAKNKAKMRLVLLGTVVLNLGILAFLKYYNFLAGNLNNMLHVAGLTFSVPALKLLLPLGISFYTFQSVGYVVDAPDKSDYRYIPINGSLRHSLLLCYNKTLPNEYLTALRDMARQVIRD